MKPIALARRRRLSRSATGVLVTSLLLHPGCGGAAPAAIGVVAAGVGTGKLLDGLEDRATHVLQGRSGEILPRLIS